MSRKGPSVLGGAWSLRWSRSPAWRRIEKAHLEGGGYLLPGPSGSRKDSPNCVHSTLETGTELGLGRRQRAQTGLPIHGPRVQAASDSELMPEESILCASLLLSMGGWAGGELCLFK